MALTKKQLAVFNTSPALHELKDWFIAMDNKVEPEPLKKYFFKSYADSQGETEWGRGTVKTTGVSSGNYSQVVVKSNSTDKSFIGQKFYLISTAKTNGTIYACYSDAGNTNAGFYVEISETKFEDNEGE